MGIVIVTDSSSEIRGKEIKDLNIKMCPLKVTFGDTTYVDGKDLSVDEFYKKLETDKNFPKTSQPGPQEFLKIYKQAKKDKDDVLVITISSALSGTYQSACLAKEMAEYDNIYVVDSLACVQGLRLLVLNACRMRDEGMSCVDIYNKIEKIKHHIRFFSIIDTLEYLYKGGRLSKSLYTISQILNIKPIMSLDKDGKVSKLGQSIGYMKAYSIAKKQPIKFPIEKEYGLCYGYTTSKERLDKFISKTFSLFEMDKYDISRVGCGAGAHIGCGGVSFAYISTVERK